MTRSPIRGILFDKDGTLLDFDATWPPAYAAVADELARLAGDPGLAARIMRLGGYGDDGALDPASVFACGATHEIVEFCAGLPELSGVDGVEARVDGIFTAYGERGPLVIDNLTGLLEGLRDRELRLGIATNDSLASTESWLAYHGLDGYFDFVAGADSQRLQSWIRAFEVAIASGKRIGRLTVTASGDPIESRSEPRHPGIA